MSKRAKKRVAVPPKWKICTEGVTEANYLRRYVQALGIEKYIDINCSAAMEKGCGRQHEGLLDKMQACLHGNKAWQYEKVFLIHDYDKAAENAKEKKSFNDTFDRARQESDIYVIYSNPCIEYWLLLHLNYIDSNLSRQVCQEKVKKIVNQQRKARGMLPLHDDDYKSDVDLFEYFGGINSLEQACLNARKRFSKSKVTYTHDGIFKYSSPFYAAKAPCTNIFELIAALQDYKVKNASLLS